MGIGGDVQWRRFVLGRLVAYPAPERIVPPTPSSISPEISDARLPPTSRARDSPNRDPQPTAISERAPGSNVVASGGMPATRPYASRGIVQRERDSEHECRAQGDRLVLSDSSLSRRTPRRGRSPRSVELAGTRTARSDATRRPDADRGDDRRAERCCQGRWQNARQRATGRHCACGRSHRHGCYDKVGRRGDPGIAHPKRKADREIVEVRNRRD